jgi:MOSC domain-containing protein YiiM
MIDDVRVEGTDAAGGGGLHLDRSALEAGLDEIRRSPADNGRLELIVRRPAVDEREVLGEGTLDLALGLLGDNWKQKGSKTTADGSAHPGKQLTLMNARAATLVAGGAQHGGLAGDQLYVDLDLSQENLPAGTRLAIGSAVIEVSEEPHSGCSKFSARFGLEALRFVNSPVGRALRLRGANAFVIVPGVIRNGDVVAVVRPGAGG